MPQRDSANAAGAMAGARRPQLHHRGRGPGLALVSCLLFGTVVALLTLATQSAVQLETRIAHNAELRERAFMAAEHAIALALVTTRLQPTWTASQPWQVPATAGAFAPVADGDGDTYRYTLHLLGARTVASASAADLPGSEFHFVIEAVGRSAAGAEDRHVQGFYVRRATDWAGDPVADCVDGCPAVAAAPVLTYWRQLQAE